MSTLSDYFSHPQLVSLTSGLGARVRWSLDYALGQSDYLYQSYHYYDSFSDAKLRHWPLMSSPLGLILILSLYLCFVYYGQRYVHHHLNHHPNMALKSNAIYRLIPCAFLARPFYSNRFLFAYNSLMSLLNGWIFYELLSCGIARNYNFLCQLVYTRTDNPFETRIAHAMWWYFASKGIELLDTVFIVVRRKTQQLTFLHTYHHSTMFAVWWVGAKFVPGGSALTGALVNCLVHVLMYGYYALSALGPRVRPYLWWKKYLTIIQLVQFTAGVSLGLSSIISGCQFTRWMQYVFVAYAFSFLILFGKFYRKTYASKGSSSHHQLKWSDQHQIRDQAIKQMLLAAAAGNLALDQQNQYQPDSQWSGSSASRRRSATSQGRAMHVNLLKSQRHNPTGHRRRKLTSTGSSVG